MTKPFRFITADGLESWAALACDKNGHPLVRTVTRDILRKLEMTAYQPSDVIKPDKPDVFKRLPTRDYEREWTGREYQFVEQYRVAPDGAGQELRGGAVAGRQGDRHHLA